MVRGYFKAGYWVVFDASNRAGLELGIDQNRLSPMIVKEDPQSRLAETMMARNGPKNWRLQKL